MPVKYNLYAMKKAFVEGRIILLMGVIVVCLLALAIFFRVISPGLDSSVEGQAKVMANTIAISINTLSRMDAGRVEKSFSFKQPVTVEVYNKGDVSYIRVTYGESLTYEVPLLVKIDPVPPLSASAIRVEKNEGGTVSIKGEFVNLPAGSQKDVGCGANPSPDELQTYISSAADKYKVEKNLIKAVIMKESEFQQCRSDGTYVVSEMGAIGLMQLVPDTASGLGVNPKNAQQNIEGGTKYLRQLTDMYNGDKEKAVAAYFGGTGNLQEIFKKPDWKASLPTKTKEYLTLVTLYKECYDNGCKDCNCNPQGKCVLC